MGAAVKLNQSRVSRGAIPSQIVRACSQVAQSSFVDVLSAGVWFVSIYNDDAEEEHTVAFTGSLLDVDQSLCPSACHGHGECRNAQCDCFSGYTGWDCSQREYNS